MMITSMMMTIDEAMTMDMVTGHQQVVVSVEQQIAFDGKRVQDTNTQNLIHDDTHNLVHGQTFNFMFIYDDYNILT